MANCIVASSPPMNGAQTNCIQIIHPPRGIMHVRIGREPRRISDALIGPHKISHLSSFELIRAPIKCTAHKGTCHETEIKNKKIMKQQI
jgi:hypothetical protein